MAANPRSALEGIRVIDTAWAGPGPFCSNILGDLGADVVKVREVQAGAGRRGGKPAARASGAYFGQRNARSIRLDLKSEVGREVFYRLVKVSDVVMEGFRPGVVKRLGIDYDTLHSLNDRIIYASLSGYGQDGPYRDLAGHDLNYLAVAGFLGRTTDSGGAPVVPGTLLADFAAGGMSAAIGILAALMARERTSKGQRVDCSMADAVVELMGPALQSVLDTGTDREAGRNLTDGSKPWYNVYQTKDGRYISVGAIEPWFYEELCRALECPEFINDQYCDEDRQRVIFARFRCAFLARTRDEWVSLLRAHDTCVAPVYSMGEVVADPHIRHRMIIEVEHPEKGKVKQVGSMLKLSDTPVSLRGWNLHPGQHTDAILTALGYSAEEKAGLRSVGAVA